MLFRGENSIEEVIVSVKRKVDRLIFNVNNSISSIGENRLEVLNKAPEVRVNNENIGIIG
ncbi:MAG: hypothetical protein GQ564_15060 [Bacteroidales bacterium]|nr:hypothetical protein [Bacteroidales bacterium]